MKISTLKTLLMFGSILLVNYYALGQCADTSNIYTFMYNGIKYEVIKENKEWIDAAACAVERGGILTEINDQGEQDAIFTEIKTNSGVDISKTVSQDGVGSYVWLGGNDMKVEGDWMWNGNNDSLTTQFWKGRWNGSVVGGLYNNWGREPDDAGGQDGLVMAIGTWPRGVPGDWNDVKHTNKLYYVIEYPPLNLDGIESNYLNNQVKLYPNPAGSFLTIESDGIVINEIVILSSLGQKVKAINPNKLSLQVINMEDMDNGVYFISISTDKNLIIKKIIR